MKAFHIVGRTIVLRDHSGDLFQFMLVPDRDGERLRVAGPPRWKDGAAPANADARLDLAFMAARDIARRSGLMA